MNDLRKIVYGDSLTEWVILLSKSIDCGIRDIWSNMIACAQFVYDFHPWKSREPKKLPYYVI